jgi:hypothetical protein
MGNKIIIPCKEANHVCDKTQYKEATLWEKFLLNIHLIYCKFCRKYSKNNANLTKLMTKNPVNLDPISKENLRTAFEKELAKHK